jgi:hypothetical protein
MSSHLSPSVTHSPLPYHEVSAARLPLVTTSGLVASGIPAEAMGLRRGKKQVLSSCFSFSDYARELLPVFLGGTASVSASRIGTAPSEFLAVVAASSPVSASKLRPMPSEVSASNAVAPVQHGHAPVLASGAPATSATPRGSLRLSGSQPVNGGMVDPVPKPRAAKKKAAGGGKRADAEDPVQQDGTTSLEANEVEGPRATSSAAPILEGDGEDEDDDRDSEGDDCEMQLALAAEARVGGDCGGGVGGGGGARRDHRIDHATSFRHRRWRTMKVCPAHVDGGLVRLDGRSDEGNEPVGDVVNAQGVRLNCDQVLPWIPATIGHRDAEFVDHIDLARVTTGVGFAR